MSGSRPAALPFCGGNECKFASTVELCATDLYVSQPPPPMWLHAFQELRLAVQADIQKTLNKSKAYNRASQAPKIITKEHLETLSAPKAERMHRVDQARLQQGVREHTEFARLWADALEKERLRTEARQRMQDTDNSTKQENLAAYRQYKAQVCPK